MTRRNRDLVRLRTFNLLRNKIAHTLDDAEALILETLESSSALLSRAQDVLSTQFFYLFCGELVGVKGAHWVVEQD